MKKILILFAVLFPVLSYAQPDEVAAKKIRATQKLQIDTGWVSSIKNVVNSSSTYRQLPTAKAVWDLFGTVSATITTDATLAGAGTSGSPLKIAQQGATSGQVLKWNGTTWQPAADAGTNITAGVGIGITGTPPNITISNTGDTNAGDDITTSTTLGGDLSGTLPNPTVAKIQTRAVSSTAPTLNQVLKWNGSAWAPAADATGGGGVSDGDKGDITVSGSGAVWTIDAGAVTYAKMQDVTPSRLLGRAPSTTGPPQEIKIGPGLAFSSDTIRNTGVTSVGLTMPSIFSVSNSPVTSSGTLGVGLFTQSPNTVFAGPSSGSAATPTFRSLVASDIPVLFTGTSGQIPYFNSSTGITSENGTGTNALTWDATNNRLGVGTTAPGSTVDFNIPANTSGLYVNYNYFTGTSAKPFAIRNQDGLETMAIGGNRTGNEGNLFLKAPSVQGGGAGIEFQSNHGGSVNTSLFQLDNSGNMVFRQLTTSASLYFDYGSNVYFRDVGSGYITRASISNGNLNVGTFSNSAARMVVFGQGNTSSTFASRIGNSLGNYGLSVRDDRAVIFDNLTGTGNRLPVLDANGIISRGSVDPATIPTGNIYTADGTTTAARTVTIGANELKIFTSNASGSYPGLSVQTYSDGTQNNDYFVGKDQLSTARFRITGEGLDTRLRSINGAISVVGAQVNMIAGTSPFKTMSWKDDGTLNLPASTITTPTDGDMWYSGATEGYKFRQGTSTRTTASQEKDIVGNAVTVGVSAITITGENLTYYLDANAGGFAVTLGPNMLEGHFYTVRCVRNGTNVITFGAASGHSLAIDGDGALTPATLSSGGTGTGMSAPFRIYLMRRMGSVIYIK